MHTAASKRPTACMPVPRKLSTSGFAVRLSAFYAAYFVLIGIQLLFFPLWLEAKGLDAAQIGLVLAAPAFVRVAAVPLLTRIADRRGAVRETLIGAAIAAALGYTAVGFSNGALAILVAVSLAAIAHTPIVALSDALAIKGVQIHGGSYGGIRLWGSVAFIAANLGGGLLLDVMRPVDLIWTIAGAAVFAALVSLLLTPLPASPAAADTPVAPLWRDVVFLTVITAAGLIQASHAFYYGFSTIAWRAAGFDGAIIGLLWALGVVAEIILFAFSGRLPPWLSAQVLLLLGAAGGLIRWTAMALDPPAFALPLLQVLHAATFGAAHLGLIGYIAHRAPQRFAATAQGYYSILSGVLLGASMSFAGILYERFGSAGYAGMAVIAALGGVLVAAASAKRETAM
jgi:PPP family 3-phenylpropionic acid transporter